MAIIEYGPHISGHSEQPMPQITSTALVPELETLPPTKPTEISRRKFLSHLIFGAAIPLVAAKTGLDLAKVVMDTDATVTELGIVRREGSVKFVNRETKNRFPSTTTLEFRGFNVDEIDTSGERLAPYIKHYGQVATVDYGNEKFEPESDITDRTIDFCRENNITCVNLWGRSMGGMVTLQLVPALRKANIAIESIVLESSPASYEDAIGADDHDVTMITIYNELARLGWVSYGGQKARNYVEGKANEIMSKRDPNTPAFIKSNNELPNNIVMQQLGFICSFSIPDTTVDILKDVPIAYIGAKPATEDHTVNVSTAYQRFKNIFKKSSVHWYGLDDIGHASSATNPDIYGKTAIAFRRECGLPLW